MREEWIGTGRHFIGRTADGTRVIVEARLSWQDPARDWQTVDHRTVTDPVGLSVSGEAIEKHQREASSAGQITDMAADVTAPAPGWSLEEIAELVAIWRRWHLNTLRAACSHMDIATLVREPDSYGGTRIATGAANTCPVSGYTYGAAWLTEELPAEVIERMRHLMRDRSADLYAARGYDGAGNAVTR